MRRATKAGAALGRWRGDNLGARLTQRGVERRAVCAERREVAVGGLHCNETVARLLGLLTDPLREDFLALLRAGERDHLAHARRHVRDDLAQTAGRRILHVLHGRGCTGRERGDFRTGGRRRVKASGHGFVVAPHFRARGDRRAGASGGRRRNGTGREKAGRRGRSRGRRGSRNRSTRRSGGRAEDRGPLLRLAARFL
jgi:hypothetical protein